MALGMTLRITQDGVLCGPKTRIWIDGHEVTEGVQRVTLDMLAGNVTTAKITVLVRELEIDAATMAEITAKLTPTTNVVEVSS